MFKRLRFSVKVLLLPTLAAVAFIAILAFSRSVGQNNADLLTEIAQGYFPAVQMSRDLEEMLAEIQRGLQDAVSIADPLLLDQTDEIRDRFLARLREEHGNPTLDHADLQQMETQFQTYYGFARQTTLRMIEEGTWAELTMALATMRDQYNGIRETLERFRQRAELEMEEAVATAQANQELLVERTTLITLVALVVMGVLSLLLARYVGRTVRQAATVADRLAQGQLVQNIQVTSRDELGQLLLAMGRMVEYLQEMATVADAIAGGNLGVRVELRSERDTFGNAFQQMINNLRQIIGKLKEAASELATSSEEISATATQIARGAEDQSSSTEETSSTMVEMASQIDSIARASDELASEVQATSSAIQEISLSIEQGAKNAAELLSSVEETLSTIDQMTTAIRSIEGKVEVVTEVSNRGTRAASEGGESLSRLISGIGAATQDVGKIVAIIEEIAEQTNLLALNAAIEAAHAGEAGRGFAVVADEVRRLAERSVSSAREIAEFIREMRSDTDKAIQLTERTLHDIVTAVTETNDLIGEVHTAMTEQAQGVSHIQQTSARMHDLARQLSTAAKEQAGGARQISSSSESMNLKTQQVANAANEQKQGGDLVVKAAEEIAQVARQNLTATEGLAKATVSLSRQAERLKEIAEAFTV